MYCICSGLIDPPTNLVSSLRWFVDTSFLLFLNKDDQFRQKIRRKDLRCAFPEYTGGCDYMAARDFILQQLSRKIAWALDIVGGDGVDLNVVAGKFARQRNGERIGGPTCRRIH